MLIYYGAEGVVANHLFFTCSNNSQPQHQSDGRIYSIRQNLRSPYHCTATLGSRTIYLGLLHAKIAWRRSSYLTASMASERKNTTNTHQSQQNCHTSVQLPRNQTTVLHFQTPSTLRIIRPKP